MQNTSQFQMKKISRAIVFAPLLAVAPAEVAVAQTAAPMLEEVVITAQRKSESLQDTPLAITALGSRELEMQGISDLTDLRGTTPSLSIAPFVGDRATPIVFVRGIGTIVVQTTQDTAVGLYLDGVPLGRATGLAADIADIERIEVLRGPQGTLYGKNATAGAINYETKKPAEEFAFQQALTVANFGKFTSKTSVDLPVTDKLLTKFTYLHTEEDGWVENNASLPKQTDYNEQKNKAGKFALRYLPTDALTIDYSYDLSDMEYGNSFYQVEEGVGRVEKTTRNFGMSPSSSQIDGHTLTVTLEGENTTFKSITSYRELDAEIYQNYIGYFYQHTFVNQEQFTQEFQLVGSLGERFQYVAGLFYYKEKSDEWASSGFSVAPFEDIWQVNAKAKSKAIFGQGTWTPAVLEDRLSITLGLRYTDDDRSADKTFLNDFITGPIATPTILKGSISNDKINPMITFNFEIDENINSYFKVATGYRAGGFNTRSIGADFAAGFDEEEVLSYELGLKSQLFDNRVRINSAIYYNDYDDMQVSFYRSAVVTDILNASSATTKGAEIEVTAYLTDRLSTQLSYAYIDAEFKEYFIGGVDKADELHVPYAPRNAGKLGIKYDLAETRYGNYSAHLDYQHQTKTYSGTRSADVNQSYDLWNVRLQLDDIAIGNSKLRVGLWGKNITDEEYTTLTVDLGYDIAEVYGTPRTYGIDVVYDW